MDKQCRNSGGGGVCVCQCIQPFYTRVSGNGKILNKWC